MEIILSSRERKIVNHAVFRVVNMLASEKGLPDAAKQETFITLIMQLAYDHTNPWVAGQIMNDGSDIVQAVWDVAYAAARKAHEAERDPQ